MANDENQNVIRVCGAVVKSREILMVFHQHPERSYWTLPGGSVEAGETPEQAVVREVHEETGLTARVSRFLFDEPFGNGVCRCFLMDADTMENAALGYDPEESHLEASARLLQGMAWHTLEKMREDGQVAKVVQGLSNP